MDNPLERILETKNVPHALLLVNGKEQALDFAQKLVGSTKKFHPDIHHFYPEGKTGMHPIQNIRLLTDDVALAPFEADYKLFLIHDAERMLPTSANALLKTFEEPTDGTVILLLTEHREKMLPTILSRCQTYSFAKKQADTELTDLLLDYLAGDVTKLTELEKKLDTENKGALYFEQASQLFEVVMKWHRDILALPTGATLFYPSRIEQLKQCPERSLKEVEKRVRQARLGLERSMKFSHCMMHI